MKILVLCHGNINRSPLCAAVLSRLGHEVLSAGFVNPDTRASKKMRDEAARHGYNLESHRSQLCTIELCDWAEKIVVMDGGNEARLKTLLLGSPRSFVTRLQARQVTRLGWHGSPHLDRIPDPAFLARDSFKFIETVELIIERSEILAKELSC
jgi:protein-tyrosine-phosphatase